MVRCTITPCRAAVRLNSGVRPLSEFSLALHHRLTNVRNYDLNQSSKLRMKELSVASLTIAFLSAIIWTVLVYVVDPIFPPEIVEQCTSSRAIRDNEVIHGVRGSGGGTALCKLKSPPPPQLGNTILIKRSWLLGLCTVEPINGESLHCRRP